jgi:histidinol-phosphate aminotransferase
MDPMLRHHGDVDAVPGLLDFAVNVRGDGPPDWLRDRLAAALDRLGRYPSATDDAATRAVVAARHGRDPDEVLVLGGVAEGFALLPALLQASAPASAPGCAAVVHPSFTEPEVALRRAGIPVHRVLTDGAHRLRPERVPPEADLVVLGNPTNPTSVLHPADLVRSLARRGRVLVVDEAFADAVPGEPESLAADRQTPGLLVLRSLPGLRAGYALGAPGLLARLAGPRPPWPVSSLVLEAVRVCCAPAAVAQARSAAVQVAGHRDWMARRLGELPGVTVHQPAAAPFLLLHVPAGERVRAALRDDSGIAVRRADTFPGLTSDHLRVAVRPSELAARLVAGLRGALARPALTTRVTT